MPWNEVVTIEELDPSLMEEFTCGNDQMDMWFSVRALEWARIGLCQVYAALDDDGVAGFFSLSPASISPVSLSNRQRHGKRSIEHPGYLLGRLAVRRDLQKTEGKVGSALLDLAIEKAKELSKLAGGRFLILDAKDDKLACWYERHGFIRLRDNRLRLILPLR